MKRLVSLLMAVMMVLSMAACRNTSNTSAEVATEQMASVEGASSHKIGVIVYNIADEQVVTFREYLENYIASVFPGVTFLYSNSINTQEEEMAYLQEAIDEGVDGILSFNSYDVKAEVELCAKNQVYYMMASRSVSDEVYESVADNEYFMGVVGPGSEAEYEAGSDMVEWFADQQFGDEYFILSGGAGLGNVMHIQRTVGMLDKLQEKYGVTFDQPSLEIASSPEPIHVEAGNLKVCVTPGYVDAPQFFEVAKAEYEKDHYGIVLAATPVYDMSFVIKGAKLGVIDCYTTRNLQLFTNGQLNYVVGKYSSIIGPSFAIMYNAITGYAKDFRLADGKAIRFKQDFWYSSSYDDYMEKYTMASSVVTNAYNYEDLKEVCKEFNKDASVEKLQALAESSSYEDAKARRGQ